ncbi:unnamed protein product [Lactuca virosa]|uniref:Uncharacterized protein n=1 Tax=Lactuca virosa TaxID=75947 RepID=A0AAU9PAA2_9ASTR|nr:unnamed protein product [Lactuca virosa]
MTSISELKAEGVGGPLQVRILRKWKHDVRQYETWYLAVDRFLDKYQKVLENEFYIDVGLKSIIQPIPDTITVPKSWFRFVSKLNLIQLGETPPYYPDFIGVLSKIRDCTKANREPFVLLILTDERMNNQSTKIQPCLPRSPIYNNGCCSNKPKTINIQWSITARLITCYTYLCQSRYTGDNITHNSVRPSRPIPALSRTPSTLYNMKLKNRSDLLDKTFIVEASIKEFHFQNSWYQTTCPICKDPIFRTSTTDNICFIIIDIQESTTPSETPIPTTPAVPRMTRMRPDDGTPEPSRPPRPVARTLTFTPPGPPPPKNQKRTTK